MHAGRHQRQRAARRSTRTPGAYRPGSRAINYRSEPFMDRLNFAHRPALRRVQLLRLRRHHQHHAARLPGRSDQVPPGPRRHRGLPRLPPARRLGPLALQPQGRPDVRLRQDGSRQAPGRGPVGSPRASTRSRSARASRIDLEIENGAGGAQQGAGEFLFHCHIAHHYFAGMWGYWRVYDTLQPDLMPLTDRTPMPQAVDSSALVGKTIAGQQITASNLDAWIRPQLPTQGVTHDINVATRDNADQDASVWDWTVDPTSGLYLGEPDRDYIDRLRSAQGPAVAGLRQRGSGSPGRAADRPDHRQHLLLNGSHVHFDAGGYIGNRPKLLFDPANGRPAFPMLRPHIGKRTAVLPERPQRRALPGRVRWQGHQSRGPGGLARGHHADRPVGQPLGRHLPGRRATRAPTTSSPFPCRSRSPTRQAVKVR